MIVHKHHQKDDGIIAALEGARDELNAVLALLRAVRETPVGIAQAAQEIGVSKRWLGKPWNVPDWKRNGTTFAIDVWRKWLSSSEAERRQTWDFLGRREGASA